MSNEESESEDKFVSASQPVIPTSNEHFQANSLQKIASALSMKTPTSVVILATQLGISYTLSKLAKVPERDILMEDFMEINIYYFPSSGSSSNKTASHKYGDFRFKDYAPVAFRYFRKFFGIQLEDFLHSLCDKPMKELSRSGSSGSLLFKTDDDLYVVKTVDQREAKFLQCLLPGYYMNLEQNQSTLLPKFFGLYHYSSLTMRFRFVIMNNLLPSYIKLEETYDIKGSTFGRRATEKELKKTSPTLKDLDFLERHPKGFMLDPFHHNLILSTLERDVRVLTSFKIMDYSLLIGVHDVTAHQSKCLCGSINVKKFESTSYRRKENLSNEMRGLVSKHDKSMTANYQGGIPAKSHLGHNLLLFIGIIDILQNYRLSKKLEHGFKSFIHDGNTISVNNPQFYQRRFLEFCKTKVFTQYKSDRPINETSSLFDSMSNLESKETTSTTTPPSVDQKHINSLPINDDSSVNISLENTDDQLKYKQGIYTLTEKVPPPPPTNQ